jgi:hypothetical protein
MPTIHCIAIDKLIIDQIMETDKNNTEIFNMLYQNHTYISSFNIYDYKRTMAGTNYK